MSMQRVNYDDLELELDEWGNHYWEGKLFTGISYELYEDGQLRFEGEYKNGGLAGPYREWYPSLSLQSEGYLDKDHSWERKWFENGQLKHEKSSNRLSGYFRERKWNDQGELIYDYERPSSEEQA